MTVTSRIFQLFVGLFLVLLPLQFLFAGYGVFSGKYDTHEVFGFAVLHGATLLMFLTGLVARRWKLAALCLLLFVVMGLQMSLPGNDEPWVAAFHPFLAFCFWPFVYFLVWRPLRGTASVGEIPATA